MSDSLRVEAATGAVWEAAADAVVVPVPAAGSLGPTAEHADEVLGGLLTEMRESREFRAEACETSVLPTLGRLPVGRLVLVGLGPGAEVTPTVCMRAVAAAARAAGRRGFRRLAAEVADLPLSPAAAAAVLAEGAAFSRYVPDPYRTTERRDTRITELRVTGGEAAALREGAIRGEARNLARTLANEPSNHLDPPGLAARAAALAAESGLECEVLDEADMERLEMGAILAVTGASETPGRLIVLRHRGGGDGPTLALVGKAVMFDTGGISLKPAADMGKMKGDMAGGAAVLAAMRAIAELPVPANVLALIPAVFNMPDGRAWKPGDVITAKSGKTIETISTDAEGRMLLADCLTYAREQGAAAIVDIATLTGACAVALGQVASGLFGTNDALIAAVRECGAEAGELHWPMPLFREYRELIRSDIADLKNSGGRLAGAVTAAWFIREFAGDTPWAHLDIAGSGSSDKSRAWAPAGPTGIGVGTFVNLARRWAEGLPLE